VIILHTGGKANTGDRSICIFKITVKADSREWNRASLLILKLRAISSACRGRGIHYGKAMADKPRWQGAKETHDERVSWMDTTQESVPRNMRPVCTKHHWHQVQMYKHNEN